MKSNERNDQPKYNQTY